MKPVRLRLQIDGYDELEAELKKIAEQATALEESFNKLQGMAISTEPVEVKEDLTGGDVAKSLKKILLDQTEKENDITKQAQKKAMEIYCAGVVEAVGKLGYKAIAPFFDAVADLEEETITFSVTAPLSSELVQVANSLIKERLDALCKEVGIGIL